MLTEMGRWEKIQGKRKDDECAFKYAEFEVQIQEAIQCAVCITYAELKIGIINLGVGNTGMMVKPWEWMKSAKKCVSSEMKKEEEISQDAWKSG